MPRNYCGPCYALRRAEYSHKYCPKRCDDHCRFPNRYIQYAPPAPPIPPPPIGEQAHLVLTGEYDPTSTLVTFSLINDGEITAADTVVNIVNDGGVILSPLDITVTSGTVLVDALGNIEWTIGDLPIDTPVELSFLQLPPDVGDITFDGTATTSTLNNPDANTASVVVSAAGQAALNLVGEYVNPPGTVGFDITNDGTVDAENVNVVITSDPVSAITAADVTVTQGTVDVTAGVITWTVGTVPVGTLPGTIMLTFAQPAPIPPATQDWDGVATTDTPNDPTNSSFLLTIV